VKVFFVQAKGRTKKGKKKKEMQFTNVYITSPFTPMQLRAQADIFTLRTQLLPASAWPTNYRLREISFGYQGHTTGNHDH
jgi:hypothetical protein